MFFLCEPDDIYEDGEVMQFSLLKNSKIEVGSITVDEDGIHYFTRSESEIFPENGLFFSEEEGDAFIAEHCGEFNSLKIKHGDPIYHHFITDHIESARFSCECKDIIIRTKNGYKLLWRGLGKEFTLTKPDIKASVCYALVYDYHENACSGLSKIIGVFPDFKSAAEMLNDIKQQNLSKHSFTSERQYTCYDRKGYNHPSHVYTIQDLPYYAKGTA